jgi:IS30 family transposase
VQLPQELRRSLTWDRGKEMADHKHFTIATNVQVYFCDPRSPWQRGSNENTNGLLRQYFPRGTDLSRFSQAYLNKIALRLNQRPRRPWASKPLPIDYARCCIDRLNPPPTADNAGFLLFIDAPCH